MTRDAAATEIGEALRLIALAEGRIESVAQENVTDYHFLYSRVSRLWTCALSPIGYCVFKTCERDQAYAIPEAAQRCRFCGGPTERK